ncbi:endonuclease/exonuclease/phosphatase family protein, partial [Myxococcota bacterium]|nr:endonuclease/exonuclease/phosphatase family protein [Myxococcota bacterium]
AAPEPDAASGACGPDGCRLRVMAANLTSNNLQEYELAGMRIFQGLDPDIVLIQEFDVSVDFNSRRDFVDRALGAEFDFDLEMAGLPNGVISRWPIVASGAWPDPLVGDRDFFWARIDIPGDVDLWAISVHLKAGGGGDAQTRAAQAINLIEQMQREIPEGDYIVFGGDLNTGSRDEAAVNTLAQRLNPWTHIPVDQSGNDKTNMNRNEPYDWVIANPRLDALHVPIRYDTVVMPHGLVFDSRVFRPLSAVAPVLSGDSDHDYMQHLAVIKEYRLP